MQHTIMLLRYSKAHLKLSVPGYFRPQAELMQTKLE